MIYKNIKGSDLVTHGSCATVTLTKTEVGQNLFVSLPYREGLSVRVNGKKTEASQALGMFLLIPLEAGENVKVEICYRTPCLAISIVLTGMGVLIAGIWFFLLVPHIRKQRGYRGKAFGVLPAVWLGLAIVLVYVVPTILSVV